MKCSDRGDVGGPPPATSREVHRTLSFRGRRSRNKVSVGEPAEGSLSNLRTTREHVTTHRGGAERGREPAASVAPPPVREAPGAPSAAVPRARAGAARGGPLERTTNPGAERAKEPHNEATRPRRPGPDRARRGSSSFHQTQTTLGNGYLVLSHR